LDRADAATALLNGLQSDKDLRAVLDTMRDDPSAWAVAEATRAAGRRRRTSLRASFRALLRHKDIDVRTAAVEALGKLPKDAADMATLQGLVNETEAFAVVTA